MDSIRHFFQMLSAWKFWYDLFHGFAWLDWVLFVAAFALIVVGVYRGFGFLFAKLIYVFAMAVGVTLVYPWIAEGAIRYLSFAKAGFWNPVCFALVGVAFFYLFKKLALLQSKKMTPSFHPFWDRVIGAVIGFFFALLLISFVSQFFLLLPSKSIAKLYGQNGARYGIVLKQFVPKVVDSALAPIRLIVNRK
ncbi:MAG TPA: hypothetical protein DIS66_06620 [Candidatus Omnitrophica bacterium]|nr:hypothetical protein [Candidatus Omnitrophota bacterium]